MLPADSTGGESVSISPMFAPIVALVLWSFVLWAWLYATRIPAMLKLKLLYDPRRPASEFIEKIPPQVQWKADNYNHLMEQPTLFYALGLVLALTDGGDRLNAGLAWAYVAVRVVHSLIQATVNVIPARFGVFMLGSLVLLAMAVRAALIVF
jgi:hypothetical protein